MDLVLETERLTLVPYRESDTDIAVELFTDPAVTKFAGGPMPAEKIRAENPLYVRRGGNGCIGVWCVTRTDTGEKLGTGALLPIPIEEKDTDFGQVMPDRMPDGDVEIGYFLKPSAWGKGYATEVCRRLVRFAFEQSPLDEVVATFEEGNDASRNVLLKSGFIDHGMRRCYGEDGANYRISKAEWLAAEA